VFCGNENDYKCGFCETCPVKEAEENFKDFSVENLDANPNTRNKWQDYGFDNLYKTLLEVISLEDLPAERRTITTDYLIHAWTAEKNRAERIDQFNRRTASE
jgi:hypothetical protein